VQRRDNRETCILTNVREHLQEHKRPAGGGDGADLLAVNPLGRAPRTRLFRQSLPGLLRRGWPTWQPALSTFEVSPPHLTTIEVTCGGGTAVTCVTCGEGNGR
jgi:hypothetical protein